MASIHIKICDRLFLKTTSFIFFIAAIKYFFDGRWALGIFLVITAIWGIGGIGQGLYPELSFKELATGGTEMSIDDSHGMSVEESLRLIKAIKRLSILIFIVMLVVKFSSGVPFWKSVGLSFLMSAAFPVGYVLYIFIIGLFASFKKRK
jgi:hypothetical protein